MKYKILALFGEAGSGKDYLRKAILTSDDRYNPKLHGIVSTTTRPPRTNEKNGEDYYFVSDEEFGRKVLNFSMLEATSFNSWFYGTTIEDLDPSLVNIGVFSISAIEMLLSDERLIVYPVYIKTLDKTRIIRQLEREANPNINEICRRYMADVKDFSDIPFSYKIVINDPLMTCSFDPIPELKEIIADLDKIV